MAFSAFKTFHKMKKKFEIMHGMIKILILVGIFAATNGSAVAQNLVLQADDVIVVFDESLRYAAEEIRNMYPGIKQELENMFGWYVDFRPTVVLVKRSQQFQQMAGTDLIVAYAIPQKNLMVIDYSKMQTSPFSLKSTVKHELCHLLLHNYIRKEDLPRWLDEGISQWASDGIAELIMDHKRSVLRNALLRGRYFRMSDISRQFPRDKNALQLAYAQSRSFVDYMVREYGPEGVLHLLNNLRNGIGFEIAVQESFAISIQELEDGWVAEHTGSSTWFTYLSLHLYEFIFIFGAIAVIIGFVRAMIKKRRYADLEDEEE
jgi:hypothetical protein